ncbi:MAG: L-2-amino-thiazoline-4-carboxylic acid hydrolase [Erysipelotrichaceae bacterium]|nr:L-2-amino-thiazoline-4-carboxylic acid hydrolase [Erysipelotrichaceae bacterium]
MDRIFEKTIIRYLKKHYPDEYGKIVDNARRIYPQLMKKAPDLGGRKNSFAYNMRIFILFLSYYEGSDHRIDGLAFSEIFDEFADHYRLIGNLLNINRKPICSFLRKYFYISYQKYADTVASKQAKGEWMNTWGMVVDPDHVDEGFAFTLVGCPLADYARDNGYQHLMPYLCSLDHAYAKLMHAKLIRNHTVASGADSCDYWYVPDQSNTAKDHNDKQ